MTIVRQIAHVVLKDLLVEWRFPARTVGVFVFAAALVLLVAFAGSSSTTSLRRQAASTLWLGLVLASTRSLDRSFQTETEQGALEGLVLWPVDPLAVYYGKALANTLMLLLVAVGLTPVVIALFDAEIKGNVALFFAFLALGSAAIAAPGTLYGLITAQARGASVMLPVLLLPIVMPAVLAAARGCAVLMEGDPMGQGASWFGVLVLFDVVHWCITGFLFARILEDS